MTELIIRPIAETDRTAWARMWTDYLSAAGTPTTPQIVDVAFSRLKRADYHEPRCLIAERGGAAVGLAHYLFHRMIWSIEDTCFLMDVYTTPEARGTGAGRALIEAVHAEARAAGIPDLYWHASADNTGARALYDKIATLTDFVHYEKKG